MFVLPLCHINTPNMTSMQIKVSDLIAYIVFHVIISYTYGANIIFITCYVNVNTIQEVFKTTSRIAT